MIELNKNNKDQLKTSLKYLKNIDWQFVICPHQSIRSHKITLSLKAQKKIGFKNFWNFFIFDKTLVRPMHLPDALRQLSLLSLLNEEFKNSFNFDSRKYINLKTQNTVNFRQQPEISKVFSMTLDITSASNTLEKFGVLKNSVFIAPGSVWPTKRWTIEGFKKIIKMLKAESVVLIGSKDEVEICKQLEDENLNVINLCGKTSLTELIELLKTAKYLISNDSGTMHMASLVGCPAISIFGPTTLDLGYRPWQDQAIVVQKPLNCRPCGKHGHMKCPIGTHECMKSIAADEVYKSVHQLIGKA